MNHEKKQMAFIAAVAASLFIMPLLVFAAVYSSDQRKNQFAPANDNVQIAENNNPAADTQTAAYIWTALTNEDNTVSAYAADKSVVFRNGKSDITDTRQNNDEYLRARFVPVWYDGTGNVCGSIQGVTEYSSVSLNHEDPAQATALVYKSLSGSTMLTLHLHPDWAQSWRYDPDGQCFYYKELLRTDRTTDPLLVKAEIPKTVSEKADGYTLHLDVLADAVQKSGSAASDRWDTPAGGEAP